MSVIAADRTTAFPAFRVAFPYTFVDMRTLRRKPKPIPGYPHIWLALNREYKPLGLPVYADWVDYEDYAEQAWCFSRDPFTFKGVWYNVEPPGPLTRDTGNTYAYLYADSLESRRTYWERLDRLLGHKHVVYGRHLRNNGETVTAFGYAAPTYELEP